MSTQSPARFLVETPPYCPTVECYQHGNGQEHHVEGCPVAETLGSTMHAFGHAAKDAAAAIVPFADAIRAELRTSWRGRLMLLGMALRRRVPWDLS
jgi:hypothetical protein